MVKTTPKKKTARKKTGLNLPRKTAAQKKRAGELFDDLAQGYPAAACALNYSTPHELLIATILSAQATDVGVNKATPKLFRKFPQPVDYARSTPGEIEGYINSIGLFRGKAKSIHASMTLVVEEFGGKVPETMAELLRLRGVARKTANVVLGNAFAKAEGVVVDTHVARLAGRYGLTKESDPKKIELDLMALYPRERWTLLAHLLIFHGRNACKARMKECGAHAICGKYRKRVCCT